MENYTYVEELAPDELKHYGVLGMKWGVRRYQNKDGTLTSEGKTRVSKLYDKAVTKKNKLERKADQTATAYAKAKARVETGDIPKYQKLQNKTNKLEAKAIKKRYSWWLTSARRVRKAEDKAYAAQLKADRFLNKYEKKYLKAAVKADAKAEKWVNAMSDTFTDELLAQIKDD